MPRFSSSSHSKIRNLSSISYSSLNNGIVIINFVPTFNSLSARIELTFRIEAILRRVRGKRNRESTVYKIGRFTFDTQKQILSIGDKQTKLTTKESELLGLLCAHANEILQRDFALKTIWIDDNYFNARSMDVYITKLRKHLKEDDSIEIINIHGKGYKLITPEAES